LFPNNGSIIFLEIKSLRKTREKETRKKRVYLCFYKKYDDGGSLV